MPPGEKFFAPHNDGSNARVALLMPLTHGRYSALEVNGVTWKSKAKKGPRAQEGSNSEVEGVADTRSRGVITIHEADTRCQRVHLCGFPVILPSNMEFPVAW